MRFCVNGTAYISVLHLDTQAFRYMAYTGHVAGMSLRISQGADSETNCTRYSRNVLSLAVISRKVASVRFILDLPDFTGDRLKDALTEAVCYRVYAAIIPLVRAGATITPLTIGFAMGISRMTRILLTLTSHDTEHRYLRCILHPETALIYAMRSDRFTVFSCHP